MRPDICPNCGAEVPQKARACPACGSDEKTGWSDVAHADNLGLPDESFDYDEFVQREFSDRKPVPRGMHWFWWVVGILVLLALLALWLPR